MNCRRHEYSASALSYIKIQEQQAGKFQISRQSLGVIPRHQMGALAAQRGIPLLDAETRHQRGIPLLDAKTQWNLHGQQDVRGISHWFCDAKTCCWLNTGFFGAKISGRGQFTIIHYNCFFNAACKHISRCATKSSLQRRTRKGAMPQAHQRKSADQAAKIKRRNTNQTFRDYKHTTTKKQRSSSPRT